MAITTGYLAGALGAAAVVGAGMLASYPLLLGGAVLVGTAVTAGLLLAAGVVAVGLRPDPLLTARARAGHDPAPTPRLRQTLPVLAQIPAARRSLAALAVVHAVVVSVMNMASLYLHHGGATLRVVGPVISVHLAGMFLLAPVFGWLADRLGAAIVLALGLALLLTALLVLQATNQQAVGLAAAGLGHHRSRHAARRPSAAAVAAQQTWRHSPRGLARFLI